ncbi:MAG: hypothetical protein HZB39_02765 [Planctomycetes bacterium]|nr:hypothetical protein [Planctomycetota bacterium]
MLAFCAIAGLRAQVTFHVYVNPINGDNAHAWAQNPHWTGGPSVPFQSHPDITSGIQGILQHAPYSFRTLSGAQGAVAYASSIRNGGSGAQFVLIHCQNGLYGPRNPATPAGQEEFDPASGLPWNDERFPIDLPANVCVQGTSTLDTIFDARGYVSTTWYGSSQTIFRFYNPVNFVDYSNTFIDSVALRGCRTTIDDRLMGAAILIGGEGGGGGAQTRCSPRITNCFIYGNFVGIAMFSQWFSEGPVALHQPWIVNNTIAWNQCGIYSSSGAGIGFSEPVVHNNLIDRMIPAVSGLPPYFQGLGPTYPAGPWEPVAFEGLNGADLTAILPLAAPGCGSGSCFNAFDLLGANPQRFAYGIGGWGVRLGGPGSFTPVVDLGTIIGIWNGGAPIRGDLFVRDVLRSAGLSVAPHDFRLAPTVRRADGSFFPNPLVNMGMDLGNGTIRFTNVGIHPLPPVNGSQDITAPPGIPNDRNATFHAFDWDCEGFGNPRIARRRLGLSGLFPETLFCLSRIDLGADEMGELIISGYLDSTRIFSRPHASVAPNTAALINAERMYFLDVAIPGVVYIAPQFNLRHEGLPFTPPNYVGSGPNWARPEWFAQLGGMHNPFVFENDAPPPSTLTSGQYKEVVTYILGDPSAAEVMKRHGLVNWEWTTATTAIPPGRGTLTFAPYPPFMRPRVQDIGAHLLDDIQVLNAPMSDRAVDYAEYGFQHPDSLFETLMLPDIFQDNCWHSQGDRFALPGFNDNSWMYVKNAGGGLPSSLRNGTLNPPLTIFADPDQSAFPSSFLFRNGAHPLDVWGAPGYVYTVNANGLSAGTQVQTLYGLDWYGYRQNFEIFDPDSALWLEMFGQAPNNNLQTVLVIQSEFVDPVNPVPPPEEGMIQSERLTQRRSLLLDRLRFEGRRIRR